MNNYKFYKQSIKKYGVSAKGVHWSNKYTQYKRFEILLSFIKKDLKNSSILDAGCGFGELVAFMNNKKISYKNYIGLDKESFMIKIAKKRFPNETFYKLDILKQPIPKADYIVSSGAMNILTLKECEVFIKKSFEASQKGFIFNFLKNVTFNGISKEQIKRVVKQYCKSFIIKENYLYNDFTIFMIK